MGLKLRIFVLTVGAAAGAYLGIKAHERASMKPAEEQAQALEPPVPAPAGLAVEAIIATPDATWRKAQTAIGGFVLLAPPTFGGILGTVAHVPALQTIIDGASPAYAVADEHAKWVVAAHVVSAARARTELGPDAGATGCVRLAGNYVLVGSDCDAVTTLGPYAHRTLPTRPQSPNAIFASVDHSALDGIVRQTLDARREAFVKYLDEKDEDDRRQHDGRAPDLADPKPLIGELDSIWREWADRIVGMQRAEIAFDIDDDGMNAHVSLFPPASGDVHAWLESVEGGATAPLSASPAGAFATVFWRSSSDDRERAAKETGDTLTTSLGDRLPRADEAKVAGYVAQIAKARAGWAMISVTAGAAPGILARLATNDAPKITSSIEGMLDLAKTPAWSKWEKDSGITKVERAQDRATFTTGQAPFQVAWAVRGGEVDIAGAADAPAVLGSIGTDPPLSSDAKVSAWLREIRANVVCALVARPLLVTASPRSDALMLALGRERDHLVLHARASGVLVRQLVVSAKGL